MAAQVVQEPEVLVPTADVVGNAFARQYYAILQQSPTLVHRFYQDISKLGRIEHGGAMSSTTTMTAIDEKIQSLGSLKADIKFVDAQDSYNGGVIVLVTGFMIKEDDSRRAFTQTFFLAPQVKGYFVLNDIFRYLEDDVHVKQENGIFPAIPSQEEAPPVQENHNSEQSNGEVYNPSDNGELPVEEVVEEEEEEPVAEVVDEAPDESQVVVESNVKVQDMPKKSYASIVMKEAPATAPSPNPPKSVPKIQEKQVPATLAPSPTVVAPTSGTDIDNGHSQEQEGDGHSIYLRNLPMNVPYAVIEEEFKRFGPVKPGGIQIRYNKGFCFGFVEFEVASAVQSAIEASPIPIGGREVVIEEKKSTNSRGSNRGRFSGKGSGFRNDGGRGRGSYGGGGRGYGWGESNKSEFVKRGGGHGYQNRGSEGYQRGDQAGNGAGRANRVSGSGAGTARGQKVTLQS